MHNYMYRDVRTNVKSPVQWTPPSFICTMSYSTHLVPIRVFVYFSCPYGIVLVQGFQPNLYASKVKVLALK